MRESSKERRARLRAAAERDPSCVPHGTPSGYDWYGCRCDSCRDHHSARQRRLMKTPKSKASNAKRKSAENAKKQAATADQAALDRRWQRWTGREIEFIDAHRGELSVREIAARLGRTYYSTMKIIEVIERDPQTVARGGITTGSHRA